MEEGRQFYRSDPSIARVMVFLSVEVDEGRDLKVPWSGVRRTVVRTVYVYVVNCHCCADGDRRNSIKMNLRKLT